MPNELGFIGIFIFRAVIMQKNQSCRKILCFATAPFCICSHPPSNILFRTNSFILQLLWILSDSFRIFRVASSISPPSSSDSEKDFFGFIWSGLEPFHQIPNFLSTLIFKRNDRFSVVILHFCSEFGV